MKQKYIDRFHTKYIKQKNGCWNWIAGTRDKGYGVFYAGKTITAHRFSYLIHKGDPKALFVCHRCDNPSCVNPDHLWLGTHQDNMDDMFQKNRQRYIAHPGSNNGRAILTEKDVLEIRTSTQSNETLAKIYNMSKQTISDIKRRRTWKHV